MNEIIFLVEEAPEGGYSARGLGEALFTEAEDLAELHANLRDAVVCHFDPDRMPKMIRLQILPTRFGGIDTLPRLA